jgi:hypothetical protein
VIATFLREVVRSMKDVRYHMKVYIKKVSPVYLQRVAWTSLHSRAWQVTFLQRFWHKYRSMVQVRCAVAWG